MVNSAKAVLHKNNKEVKKMAVNKVDYEVLSTGVSIYANQAEAIREALSALISMNGQLQEGWTNQTSDAFIQRFEEEYKPALENISEAVQSISDYIQSYMQARQDDDAAGAAAVRG